MRFFACFAFCSVCLFDCSRGFSFASLAYKDMGGSQLDNDSSPNLSFNDLKQREIEIKEGSAHVL